MFPLNDLMTTRTKRYEVVDMIGGDPVSIEVSPRLDVMNIQSLAKFFLGDAAPLASEAVAFAGNPGLFSPVVAAPFLMPTQPGTAICAGCIAGFALPLKPTLATTETILANLACMAADNLAAIVTWSVNTIFVLWMGRTNDVLAAPSRLTLYRAKAIVRAPDTVLLANDGFATNSAWHRLASGAGCVTASGRAAFLLRMIARWQKHSTAMIARLLFALSLVLIAARNGTEFYRSIGSWLDRLLAVQACIHISIIA